MRKRVSPGGFRNKVHAAVIYFSIISNSVSRLSHIIFFKVH